MPSTQEVKDRVGASGVNRPYEAADSAWRTLRGKIGLGQAQTFSQTTEAPALNREQGAGVSYDTNIVPGVDPAPPAGPGIEPPPSGPPDLWGPDRRGTGGGVGFAEVGRAGLDALDYITRGGRVVAGNILEALPGEGPTALVGERGPTERTQSDEFLPAAARWIGDVALGVFQLASPRSEAGQAPLSFAQEAIRQRADDLMANGAAEVDALRVASLEETYNTLGAAGAIAGGLVLGVPATILAIPGTIIQAVDPERFARMEKSAAKALEPGSVGGAMVEFGIPEVGVIGGAAKAFQASRLRFGAGARAAQAATDAAESVRLRLDALTQYKDDLVAVERSLPEAPEKVKPPVAETSEVQAPPVSAPPPSGGVGATLEDPAERVIRAEVAAERIRVTNESARLAGDAPTIIDEVDEAALMDGIRAAAEVLPFEERATVNVGDVVTRAMRTARTSMFNAIRRAATQGEVFRMRNVTVGADAENNAVRMRMMVGQFDTAVDRMENAFREAGKSPDERMVLMAPFLRARAVAAETLAAIEENNNAIRAAVGVAKQDRTAALAAKRAARKAEAKAETAVDRATAAEGKAGERLAKRTEAEQAKREHVVGSLEARVAAQQARVQTERTIMGTVGGDMTPKVTRKSDLLGYPNTEDVRFLEENGVTNIASWDPRTVGAMAEWVRANPDEARRIVPWEEITAKTADLTGEDLAKLRKGIPKTGQMARAFYVLNQVYGAKLRAWQALGRAVQEGAATAETMTDATVDLMRFRLDLRSGIGEVARTLAQQRLLKKPDAVALRSSQTVVKARYADVEVIAKRIDALEGKIAAARAAGPSEAIARLAGELDAAVQESAAAIARLDDAKAAVSEMADRNMRAALDLAAARSATPEQLKILALYDGTELVGLADELRKLEPQGFGAFLHRGLVAGRFGRVPSQLLNFVDTGLNIIAEEAVIAPLGGRLLGIPSKIAGVSRKAAPGETRATWMSMWEAEPDSWRFFAGTVWDGKAEEVALRRGIGDYETLLGIGVESGSPYFQFPRLGVGPLRVPESVPGFGGRPFEATGPAWLPFDWSLRTLYGSDGYWRIKLNAGIGQRRAVRDAFNAGRPADAVRLLAEESKEIHDVRRLAGLTKTFNKPLSREGLDNVVAAIQGLGNIGGFGVARVLIPAMRFGLRQAETGLQYLLGGYLTGTRKAIQARRATDAFKAATLVDEAAQDYARAAFGSVLVGTGAYLTGAGVISGPLPKSEAERRRWEIQGKKPLSVKIGDTWIPLGWLSAAGAPLALSASLVEYANQNPDERQITDLVGRAAMAVGTWFVDQPAYTIQRQVLDGIWAATEHADPSQLMRIVAGAFKPGAGAQSAAESFTAVFDRYARDPEGFLQMLAAKAPGLSMTVPPRIDPVTGKPEERSVSGAPAIVQSEFQSAGRERRAEDMSAVERAIVEVGAGVTAMDRSISSGSQSVRLTQQEYVAMTQRAGVLGHEVVALLLKSSDYDALDTRGKQRLIEDGYARVRGAVRAELAVKMVSEARTAEDAKRALIVARSALSEDQYTNAVRAMARLGMLGDDVIKSLDESRPGFKSPTIRQMVSER